MGKWHVLFLILVVAAIGSFPVAAAEEGALQRIEEQLDSLEEQLTSIASEVATLRQILEQLKAGETSSPPAGTWNPLGSYLTFDGNDRVVLEKVLTGTPNTFEAWIRTTVTDRRRIGILFGNYPKTNNVSFEIAANGRPRVWWNNGQVDWAVDVDLRTGQWEHIAFVRDAASDQFLCYHNGRLVGQRTRTGTSVMPADAYIIGADHRTGSIPYLHGSLAEMRVWDHARSATEIASGFERGITGSESGLLAWWTFEAADSNRLIDHSGEGIHGTIQGATFGR